MRYFLHFAYNGTNYRGWQRQPTAISVQQTLEETISKMIGEKTICVGCGRTDAEVHASKYFAHIEVEKAFTYDPVERLNRMLPNDIAIFDCIEMPARAHTQFDASNRSYEYRMHGRKNPFLRELSAYYPLSELNFEEMQKVIALLPKQEDYRAFCKTPDIYPTTICKVKTAELIVDDAKEYAIFRITSNRFLRGMIRLLVGNMILVGQGRMSFSVFEEHLKTGISPKFYTAAHPQGLYLSDVQYPFEELKSISDKSIFPRLLF